ncbi:hypothetical protein ABFP25_01420 [Acinetobacter indicus]|uniref:hypothetical protein n=1 Tax=Acinetobacter indicus TaxID=756892 RepID=UPI0032141EA6
MQNQYFTTASVGDEISQVYISDPRVYSYLLEVMKVNFGFERYILKNQQNSDGQYLIELDMPKENLDRHLEAEVLEAVKRLTK